VVNNLSVNGEDAKDVGLILESGRSPWRRVQQPTPVFFPGEFRGHRSLEGYSQQGHKETDTTKHKHCNKNL